MNNNLLRAYDLVNSVLSQPDGSDVLYLATIYHSLKQCEPNIPLSREEVLTLTKRLCDAAGMTPIPLLTAKRADAVRYLLEYGITETMSPEFTKLSAADTRKFLLACDPETFTDLVDTVALASQEYYAPDYGAIDDDLIARINQSIQDTFSAPAKEKPAFDAMLSSVVRKEQTSSAHLPPDKAIQPERS